MGYFLRIQMWLQLPGQRCLFLTEFLTEFLISFDVRDRPLSVARIYSEPTLFDEPTRAVMNVSLSPAALIISKLLPADSGQSHSGQGRDLSVTEGSIEEK